MTWDTERTHVLVNGPALTRRKLLKELLSTTAAATIYLPALQALAQPQDDRATAQQRAEMSSITGEFRKQFAVPATSIAIARNGQFVYDHAVGIGDRELHTRSSETPSSASPRSPSPSPPLPSSPSSNKASSTSTTKSSAQMASSTSDTASRPINPSSPTSPWTISSPTHAAAGPTTAPTP